MEVVGPHAAVVAGAGHNSLVAAAYLSKAGYRCLVLEGRSILGGNGITLGKRLAEQGVHNVGDYRDYLFQFSVTNQCVEALGRAVPERVTSCSS